MEHQPGLTAGRRLAVVGVEEAGLLNLGVAPVENDVEAEPVVAAPAPRLVRRDDHRVGLNRTVHLRAIPPNDTADALSPGRLALFQ